VNPNPSSGTRFPPGVSGNPTGRVPTRWLRDFLSAARDDTPDGPSRRLKLAEHMYEVATSWEVRVVGRDSDGEVLKVADARSAVAAATLLMSYDMGKPVAGGTVAPPKSAGECASLLELVMLAYRERLSAGELSESDLASLASLLLGRERSMAEAAERARKIEHDKWDLFLRAMGPRIHAYTAEQTEAAMRAYEDDPQKFLGRQDAPLQIGEPKPEGTG